MNNLTEFSQPSAPSGDPYTEGERTSGILLPRSTWTARSARVCRSPAATASPSPTPGPTPITARSIPAWRGPWWSSRYRFADDGAAGVPASRCCAHRVSRQNQRRARSGAGDARRESPMDQQATAAHHEHPRSNWTELPPRSRIGRRDLIKLTAGAGRRLWCGGPGADPALGLHQPRRGGRAAGRARGPRQPRRPARHHPRGERDGGAGGGGDGDHAGLRGLLPRPDAAYPPGDTLRVNLVNNLETLPRGTAGG